jgi:hypothetical protein
MAEIANPLSKYYRQPSIYIKLPTGGKYYGADTFTPTETGEVPILPMTARDELLFKTPDAMMNGQATVDVIKSCVPNFKDPWQMTNYDTDAVLIGIRIATYGETMDITYRTPVTNNEVTQSVNLPALLERLAKKEIVDSFKTNTGFTVSVKPLTYKKLTAIQQAQFEQEKIYSAVSNSSMTEVQKSEQFVKSYYTLNTINFDMLAESIGKIVTPDGIEVTDEKQIREFIDNADSKIVNDLQIELGKIRTQFQIPPLEIKATEDEIKEGVPTRYQIPITFDNSNFFV